MLFSPANWYLVFCTVFCLLDARPSNPSDPGATLSLIQQSFENHSEFWTRWDSDRESSPSPSSPPAAEEQPVLTAAIFEEEDGESFIAKVHREKLVSLEPGCGRGKNRLAVLSDGTKLCCRYRQLQWREIRGEFYSYNLNHYLGISNAPPATLLKVNYSSPQWARVRVAAEEAGWSDHMTIVVTQYVEDLTGETFPDILIQEDGSSVTEEYLKTASPEDKDRILQWSDMIVFDFIIGHSDRIFNSLFNLQWNSRMLERPVHNLLKTKQGDRLLLFDNESGFWQGYRMGRREAYKYELQERYLKRICIFRQKTVERVRLLLKGGEGDATNLSATERLERYIQSRDDESFHMLEPLSKEQREEFETRLGLVLKQVASCT